MGQQKCTSKGGSTSQQEGWGSRNFSFGSYTGKQELGGIRVHLVVRTSGADLGLEHSVVVLRMVHWWPAFDPLFFLGGEAQFRDQDNSVVLIAPNTSVEVRFAMSYQKAITAFYCAPYSHIYLALPSSSQFNYPSIISPYNFKDNCISLKDPLLPSGPLLST